MKYRILLCVPRNFLLTRDGKRHWSSSMCLSLLILGRMSFNCIGQCTVDPLVSGSQSCGSSRIALQQAFNPPPTCFAVSLLPSLTSSQVSASRTTLTETPLFEVCSAKVSPCHFVLHQHLSRVSGYHLRGSLHSNLNVESIVAAIPRPWNSSYSKHPVRVPSLQTKGGDYMGTTKVRKVRIDINLTQKATATQQFWQRRRSNFGSREWSSESRFEEVCSVTFLAELLRSFCLHVRRACLDRRSLLGDDHCL